MLCSGRMWVSPSVRWRFGRKAGARAHNKHPGDLNPGGVHVFSQVTHTIPMAAFSTCAHKNCLARCFPNGAPRMHLERALGRACSALPRCAAPRCFLDPCVCGRRRWNVARVRFRSTGTARYGRGYRPPPWSACVCRCDCAACPHPPSSALSAAPHCGRPSITFSQSEAFSAHDNIMSGYGIRWGIHAMPPMRRSRRMYTVNALPAAWLATGAYACAFSARCGAYLGMSSRPAQLSEGDCTTDLPAPKAPTMASACPHLPRHGAPRAPGGGPLAWPCRPAALRHCGTLHQPRVELHQSGGPCGQG